MANIYCIFHNIRSKHNVGALFRTADGAGVHTVFLTGYTPAPVDRFGRPVLEIEKTSLGATRYLPYEYTPDIHTLIDALEAKGCVLVIVEQTVRAVPYTDYGIKDDVAFIFGNEVTGVEGEVSARVRDHIMIPMYGKKESLNVTTTAGVILFHARALMERINQRGC